MEIAEEEEEKKGGIFSTMSKMLGPLASRPLKGTRLMKARHKELLLEADVLWVEGKRKESQAIRDTVKRERKENLRRKVRNVTDFVGSIVGNIGRGIDALLDSDSEEDKEADEAADKEAAEMIAGGVAEPKSRGRDKDKGGGGEKGRGRDSDSDASALTQDSALDGTDSGSDSEDEKSVDSQKEAEYNASFRYYDKSSDAPNAPSDVCSVM